ncbi:MAG TPA: hypothetical protein VNA28_13100 [Solirubrobacteraceae bacterium]|nr:hypothetical protein [Solirubrobacteraceae bacterium]
MGCARDAVIAPSRTLMVLGVLLFAGCSQERAAVPDACFGTPASLMSALRGAPPIELDDGTRVSECVSSARSEGELQALGLLYVRVADLLGTQAPSDPEAAFALGYLAGAVARGSAASSGSIAAQLARRVDQVATLDHGPAAATAALTRGRVRGTRDG